MTLPPLQETAGGVFRELNPEAKGGVTLQSAQLDERLSRISTCWSQVFQAHQGPEKAATEVQQALLLRYGYAMYRYALAALKNPDAAEEVLQEFALCFVRGDFRKANPQGGRFRDLVRKVLCHLIVNHQRQEQRRARLAPLQADDVVAVEAPADDEAAFLLLWRDELLHRAWEGLAEVEQQGGQPYHTILRLRVEQPGLSSEELAEEMEKRLKKSISAPGARQTLHRAREKFADLLLNEVSRSLEDPGLDQVEQELIDLELLVYCRPALERRKGEE
jgi:RNA polymerase sigma factor (sigma-70 family)